MLKPIMLNALTRNEISEMEDQFRNELRKINLSSNDTKCALSISKMKEMRSQELPEFDFLDLNPTYPNEIISLDHFDETEEVCISRVRNFHAFKTRSFHVGDNAYIRGKDSYDLSNWSSGNLIPCFGGKDHGNMKFEANFYPFVEIILQKTDAMLAGGTLSRIAANESGVPYKQCLKESDYDLFFHSEDEMKKAMVLLFDNVSAVNQRQLQTWTKGTGVNLTLSANIKNISATAISIAVNSSSSFPEQVFQFICQIHGEKSHAEILSKFDLKSSMIGITKNEVLYHQDFPMILKNRHMAFTRLEKNHPQRFLTRLIKHTERGMVLPKKDHQAILEFIIRNFTEEKIQKEYSYRHTAYDPSLLTNKAAQTYIQALHFFAAVGDYETALVTLYSTVKDPMHIPAVVSGLEYGVKDIKARLAQNMEKQSFQSYWSGTYLAHKVKEGNTLPGGLDLLEDCEYSHAPFILPVPIP